MRVLRHAVPMVPLDVAAIVSLRKVRGMSSNAGRLMHGLERQLDRREPITIPQRHALYAIAWRFRRQIRVRLQAKIAIALAEAKSQVEMLQLEEPPKERVRGFRVVDGGKVPPAKKSNPLDDLFPETAAQ